MDEEEIKEYKESLLEQAYLSVFARCLLLQAGLILPAFLLGRAYEAREAAWWPNLFWLILIILSSGGLLYTVISYFKYKLKEDSES